MTFEQAMIKEMTSRGMFPEQAEEIISLYIEQNRAPQMQDIWYRSVDKYPREVLVVLWLDVKDFAAEWIRDNLPMAWFRPMFEYSTAELMDQMKKANFIPPSSK